MNRLRRLPTRKLLAVLAGVVVGGGSVTAVAVAALGGSGPIPAAKTLAAAIHDALNGPKIEGVTAQIQFTDNLVDTSSIPDAGPLLSGASGRLWADGSGDIRLELQASTGDTEISLTPGAFQVYDVASNTVYRGTLPADKSSGAEPAHQTPTLQTITDALNNLMDKVGVSGADPTDVGGAPAYSVTFSPKHDGGLLGSAELAFDAANGAPLRFSVYAQGDSSPVIELTATQVSFGPVSSSDATVTPPTNAKITELTAPTAKAVGAHAKATSLSGAAAVAAALPFKLDAPAALAGLPQTSVKLITAAGRTAALVAYGQHLGAILVIERQAKTATTTPASPSSSSSPGGLPTVTINGATGTELATALGTLVRFEKGGIDYTVLGSIPPAAAEAAARGL
ncbi:MAG TPA: hypothetical protein VG165_04670 [Solirubrobacteraceae bacterium]|nr:hypothetical protein [Solirubrobacteraceae bacterium]